MHRSMRGLTRAFGDDEPDTAPETSADTQPDYSFEGYSVEFLDKVALLPVARPAQSAGARG
jgi:hypothetical protein